MTRTTAGTTGGAAMVLAAGFLILFIGGGARFSVGLTLKPMVDELGWSRSTVSLAVTLFLIVSATSMFLAGRLADRLSLRLVLGGGLVVCGAGIGLMSLVSEPWHAVALYGVVFAIGNGVASPIPVGVMVTRAYPGRAGLANAVASSGMGLGQLIMIATLAAVLVDTGWREVYVWFGLAHLVALPLVLAAVAGEDRRSAARRDEPPPAGLSLREAAFTGRFWLLIGIYGVCGFQDFFVSTHVVAFALDQGVDTFLAGNLLAFMGLASLIGVLAAGAWSDRAGPIWPTIAAFAVRLAVFALVLFDKSLPSVAAFALLFGATFLVTAPLTVVLVRQAFGVRHLGAISGLITMVHHMMGGLGAVLGALAFDAVGDYDRVFGIMLAVNVVAIGCALALFRVSARPWSAPDPDDRTVAERPLRP